MRHHAPPPIPRPYYQPETVARRGSTLPGGLMLTAASFPFVLGCATAIGAFIRLQNPDPYRDNLGLTRQDFMAGMLFAGFLFFVSLIVAAIGIAMLRRR